MAWRQHFMCKSSAKSVSALFDPPYLQAQLEVVLNNVKPPHGCGLPQMTLTNLIGAQVVGGYKYIHAFQYLHAAVGALLDQRSDDGVVSGEQVALSAPAKFARNGDESSVAISISSIDSASSFFSPVFSVSNSRRPLAQTPSCRRSFCAQVVLVSESRAGGTPPPPAILTQRPEEISFEKADRQADGHYLTTTVCSGSGSTLPYP